MRSWGLILFSLLAACVPDAMAQPRPVQRGQTPGFLGGSGGLQGRGSGVSYGVMRRADAGAPGNLSREAIRESVRVHMNEVQRCYEAGLAVDRNLAGRVSLAFVLDANGAVTEATVVEDGLDRPQVGECIAAAALRWSFPSPGGVLRFRYPFHLRAE